MSVAAQGPGWWKASDGLWYPPEQHPDWRATPPPPPQPAYHGPGEPPPEAAPKKTQSGNLPSFFQVVPEETRTPATMNPTGLWSLDVGGGRTIEILTAGPKLGIPLVIHHGTPFAAIKWGAAADAATGHGLQLVSWSRPGYGSSTRSPGHGYYEIAQETAAVLAALGHDRFITIGWSGGGPCALASAAFFGPRCLAAAIIGCVAPPDAEGLDWFDGMAPPRVEELQAARQGAEVLEAYLRQRMASLTFADAHDVSLALGGTLSPIDVSVLNGPFGEPLLRSVRRAAESGIGGWVDDEIALVNPWGFDVRSITQPIAVCQGGEDKITPLAHGNWIVDHIPGAQRRWLLSEGHLSPLHLFETIVQDLIAQAGGARVIRPAPN